METRIQQDKDLLLIIINENLTSGSITELIQWIPPDADTMPTRVIVDLRNVTELDSSGLSALVRLTKLLKPLTSQILYCPSDVVQQVFAETNLDQVWNTYPDVAAATAALKKPESPWMPFRIQAA